MELEARLAHLEAELARQQREHATRSRRLKRAAGGVIALILLCSVGLRPTGAQNGNSAQAGGLPALEKRVAALEAQNQSQGQQIIALQTSLAQERSARMAADTLLAARATTLETKTQYLSVQGSETYFTGTNVHIRNGLGATNGNPADPRALASNATQVNGLGNLIVGYNAADLFGPTERTGSHYLVLGDGNSYTSFGGIAAGWANSVTAPYASTLGGRSNRAASEWGTIVGGAFNTIRDGGSTAAILGGNANLATGLDATVSGGSGNEASARFSGVGGGGGVVQATEFGWSAGSFGGAIQGRFSSP